LFAESQYKVCSSYSSLPKREDILKIIVKSACNKSFFISTTGKTSRELYEIRDALGQSHEKDFYTVGSMGCASSIALGVSLGKPNKQIYIVDGDGACIMQLGALATLGTHGEKRNICHVIVDNGVHESTGAQKTLSHGLSFENIAKNCGYKNITTVDSLESLTKAMKKFENIKELRLIVVKSQKGSREDLGRPKTTPIENKQKFMEAIAK
jgi:phosphonopyruvate decarboxylase